jgi:hypothetical protein
MTARNIVMEVDTVVTRVSFSTKKAMVCGGRGGEVGGGGGER